MTRLCLGRTSFTAITAAAFVALFAAPADASPIFELAGGITGDGGFNARVTGASSDSTYFNPALLVDAKPGVDLGVLVLSEQISLTLDGRRGGDVPVIIGGRRVQTADGQDISNATFPTKWLQTGCSGSCGSATYFSARPRQGQDGSGKTRAYQVIGLVQPLVGKRFVLGMHALVPLGKFTTASAFYADEREQYFSNSIYPEMYGDRMTATSIAFGVGSEIVDRFSVGLSFTLNLTNTASAGTYVRSPENYDAMYLDTHVDVNASVAPHFGFAWSPIEALHVAGVVHTEQKLVIDTAFSALLPSAVESATSRHAVHDFVPWIFSTGGTWDLAPAAKSSIVLAGTIDYSLWSRYRDRHGDEPGAAGAAYAFSNTVGGSVGARWVVHEPGGLTAHADATYVPTPVPAQTGRTNYVDNDRLGLVLGVARTFSVFGLKLRPSANVQGHVLVKRHQTKDDALMVDEVPDGALDRDTGKPIAGAAGLQTNNPGWPGFASQGFIYGGSFTVALLY